MRATPELIAVLVFISPIFLAILLRLFPIKGSQRIFIGILIAFNFVPPVVLTAYHVQDENLAKAIAITLITYVWPIGIIVTPMALFVAFISGWIVLDHIGVEE